MAGVNEFERMLTETRQLLEQVRSGQAMPPGDAAEAPAEGRGEAADGRIRVVAGVGGEVTSIELDPRVMRMASEELAAELAVAVNAALRDLRARTQATDVAIDPAALQERLREAQDQGLRQMALFTQTLDELMTRIGGRGAGPAGPGPR
jgi:DNA-binding protein YbaB